MVYSRRGVSIAREGPGHYGWRAWAKRDLNRSSDPASATMAGRAFQSGTVLLANENLIWFERPPLSLNLCRWDARVRWSAGSRPSSSVEILTKPWTILYSIVTRASLRRCSRESNPVSDKSNLILVWSNGGNPLIQRKALFCTSSIFFFCVL